MRVPPLTDVKPVILPPAVTLAVPPVIVTVLSTLPETSNSAELLTAPVTRPFAPILAVPPVTVRSETVPAVEVGLNTFRRPPETVVRPVTLPPEVTFVVEPITFRVFEIFPPETLS